MFRKILVPLDGSQRAEGALPSAVAIARASRAEVLLLRSYQAIYTTMPVASGDTEWILADYTVDINKREVRDYLDHVKERFACPDCTIRTIAQEADPASLIVDTTESEGVDLIVMTAYGRTGLRRAVFGSVTERVLNSVKVPVLVTRTSDPVRRVLITLDGSRLAEHVVAPALAASRALGASVTLLRVNEFVPRSALQAAASGESEASESDQRLMDEMRRSAETYLRDLAARHYLKPTDVQTIVLDGAPVDRIQEFARLYGIDLIAMSTHGRTGLRRWLYGSVTTKVLRATECSMLLLRPSPEELHA